MKVILNLKSDFEEILINRMKEMNVIFDKKKNIILQYINVNRKLIKLNNKVVKVYNSPQIFTFYKYKEQIENIKNFLLEGKDMRNFLSREAIIADKYDQMLNLFNIYHFHLGAEFDLKKQYIKRTGDLLYVFFYEDIAYVLGVYPHGEWVRDKWFHIIHNNWKEITEKFKFFGASEADGRTEIDIETLRRSNINVPIKIGEETYLPPGKAITTSGCRIEDIKEHDRVLMIFEDIEKKFDEILINNLSKERRLSLKDKELKFKLERISSDDKLYTGNTLHIVSSKENIDIQIKI
ncbi:hypothetical protein FV113G1_23340 [Fusobacterium varium]|nr:hypothetical protein FV113G1_23340 [Fusobacterium varium]